jgi:hypothetical protein
VNVICMTWKCFFTLLWKGRETLFMRPDGCGVMIIFPRSKWDVSKEAMVGVGKGCYWKGKQ